MITDTLNTDSNNINLMYCYEMCKSSGTLDFWDEPGEDIYTDKDGEPINEAFNGS